MTIFGRKNGACSVFRPGEREGGGGRGRDVFPGHHAKLWGRLRRSSERPMGSVLVHFSARKVDSGRKYRIPSLKCFTLHNTLLATCVNPGQPRITPQKEEKCIQNPQKAVIYTWSRPYPDDIKVYSTLVYK